MDAHFKGLVPKLEKAAQLRENFLLCQERFKEILGLSLSTSLRKSLEALALELGKEQTKKWLELTTENTRLVLTIKPNSHPPVKLRSITKHFNALTEATDTLISTALALREEIVEGSIARNIRWDSKTKGSTRASFSLGKTKELSAPELGELDSGNIEGYLLRVGFKDNRLVRAKQSFAWNVQKLQTFSHFLGDLHAQAQDFNKEATKELLQRDDISEEEEPESFSLLPKKTQQDKFDLKGKLSEASLQSIDFAEPLGYQESTTVDVVTQGS